MSFNLCSIGDTEEAHWALSQRSLANTRRADTPRILPVRGCLEDVERLMRGDFYIGRGSRQRSLKRSICANDFKVSKFGREIAVSKFREKMATDELLQSTLWKLSGARLICHCSAKQACHADVIIEAYRSRFPNSFDRSSDNGETPTSSVLNYLALLRQEPESESGSSADEGVPGPGTGWVGKGDPMMVGSGYTSGAVCDSLSLSSPGRWAPHARKYPTTEHWGEVSGLFMDFARRHGSADLLMKFALRKVEESPFGAEAISILKSRVIESVSRWGYSLKSSPQDRTDLPIDYRFLELLLDASGDPEVGPGLFARGVRVGPGSRLPRLPALYAKKKRWQLPEQRYLEDPDGFPNDGESVWRSNYSSSGPLEDKVREVLEDQTTRSGLEAVGIGGEREIPKVSCRLTRCTAQGQEGWNLHCPSPVRRHEWDIGQQADACPRSTAIADCLGHEKTSQGEGQDVREDVHTYSRCGGSSSASTD